MRQCSYTMCDGHDCMAEGTVKRGGRWFCTDHRDAVRSGIDPMFEEGEYDADLYIGDKNEA